MSDDMGSSLNSFEFQKSMDSEEYKETKAEINEEISGYLGEMKEGDQGRRLLGAMMGSILNDVKRHTISIQASNLDDNKNNQLCGALDMGLLPNTLELDGIAETGESESDGDEEITIDQ